MRGTYLVVAAFVLWAIPPSFSQSPPVIKIDKCVVEADKDKAKTFDCEPKASRICAGHPSCELPIGKNLIEDNRLQGDDTARVIVRFSCAGGRIVSRGPHDLNDHASLVLRCPPSGGE